MISVYNILNVQLELEGFSLLAGTGAVEVSNQNSCPKCGLNDKIEKVSAIVLRETSSGTRREWVPDSDGGHWATTPYTEVSNLGHILAAPPKPHYSPSPGWIVATLIIHPMAYAYWAPISRRVKIGFAIFTISVILTSIFVYFFSNSDAINILSKLPETDLMGGIALLVLCTVMCLVGPLPYAAYFLGMRQETRSRRARLEATEIPIWRKAMERWNELYYCHRDGCIFDPNTGKSGRPDQIAEMLYS